MKLNLIEAIPQRLGYAPLKKIDPNDTAQSETKDPNATDHYHQGIVTAVLAGIYKYTRTDEGAHALADGKSANWLQTLFNDNEEDVIMKVSNYGHKSTQDTRAEMERVANEAIQYIRETLGNDADSDAYKVYMVSQRHFLLSYLPAELQMGDSLDDESLDDRTNKMDGPMSSFMHNLGAAFSGSSDEKKEE